MACIFCRIAAGLAPGRKVYEDAHTMVFLGIAKNVDGAKHETEEMYEILRMD